MVDDDTNTTETTGIGTTEASGTVTGNVQEKDNNNSGSVSNIFDWAKDAISGAKDSVENVVEKGDGFPKKRGKEGGTPTHPFRGGCRDDDFFPA